MQVIYILWLRQLKRYVRARTRIVTALLQPVLFLVALGFGLGPIFARGGGGDYIQFLAPGLVAMGILFTAVFSGTDLLVDRQTGFLKELLVAPVSRVQLLLGRMLGGASAATIQGALVLLLTLGVGYRPDHAASVAVALPLMFLTALLFSALGIAVACLLSDMQAFGFVLNFVVMPLFFLSGALFPVVDLPPVIAIVAVIDPLTYGVDGIRAALGGGSHFGLALDAAVLASAIGVLLVLDRRLFSRIEV